MNLINHRSYAARYGALSLLIGLLCGCATPYSPPRFDPDNAVVDGISTLIAKLGNTGPLADILMIHGMCTHDESDSLKDAQWIAQLLGGTQRLESGEPLAGGGKLLRHSIRTQSGQINIDWLLWSPISQHVKTALCFDVTEETPDCTDAAARSTLTRATLNAGLKNTIMDGCLSDVVYYSGDRGGPAIRKAIKEGLLKSFSHRQSPEQRATTRSGTVPLFLISSSLGSKILLDSVMELSCEEETSKRAVSAAASRLTQFFMMANQIPILTHAYSPTECPAGNLKPPVQTTQGAGSPFAQIARLADIRAQARAAQDGTRQSADSPLKVIAFSDPNDLLSFTLRGSHAPPASLNIVDVMVSNANTYFGLLERPDTAHLGYNASPEVQQIIVFGRNSRSSLSQ